MIKANKITSPLGSGPCVSWRSRWIRVGLNGFYDRVNSRPLTKISIRCYVKTESIKSASGEHVLLIHTHSLTMDFILPRQLFLS